MRRLRFPAAALTAPAVVTAIVSTLVSTPAAATGDPVDDAVAGPTVTVEVLVDDESDRAEVVEQVSEEGGTVLADAPGVVLVEVPDTAAVAEIDGIGDSADVVVREPVPVDVRPEYTPEAPDELLEWLEQYGPTTGGAEGYVGADAWHSAGFTGAGVKIGVIDFFDTSYWNAAEHGPFPVAGVTARCVAYGLDCSADFFDGVDLGGERHGVAVVEILRDVAPDAEIYLGQAATTADYRILVDWFAAQGVQIISRSLGSRYDGPGDGRGTLDDIAASAVARGITWVNSGGNNGERRYYRQPARLAGSYVAFGPTGTDTYLDFRGCVQLGGVRWAGDWDLPAAQRTDYDAYLIEAPSGSPADGTVIATSTADQRAGARPIELFETGYCPDPGNRLYLRLRFVGGDIAGIENDVIEVTDYGSGLAEYAQAPYSASVPIVDSDDPGVVAVAAIDPPFGSNVASYSSQGPTNDGREAPDLAAVSGFTSAVYGSTFSGTSAAAPVVAGAAALVLDAGLATSGRPLGSYLRNQTVDRGEPGVDNRFGHGQFALSPPPDTGGIDDRPAVFEALDVPRRVLDTRADRAVGPIDLIGELWPGETLELPVVAAAGLPDEAVTAVAVNIVSVGADRPSHVQAFPTAAAELGAFSNLNIDQAGQTRANFAIVPVGDDGSISINSIARGHIVVDLLGWFRAESDPVASGRFVEFSTAQRVLDSRASTPMGSGEVRSVPAPRGVDLDRVDAWVVTVTATKASADGWVQAIPTGRSDVVGTTSTLNVTAGDTVANAAIVPTGADGRIALSSFFLGGGRADVIVDVTGYITSSGATPGTDGRFVAVRPDRAFDSRTSTGALRDRQAVTVDARTVGVPASASGVVWNVTVATTARAGHVTGWAAGGTEPSTSLLNWSTAGSTRAASAVVATAQGAGRFRVEDGPVDASTPLGQLVVDVFGYFT